MFVGRITPWYFGGQFICTRLFNLIWCYCEHFVLPFKPLEGIHRVANFVYNFVRLFHYGWEENLVILRVCLSCFFFFGWDCLLYSLSYQWICLYKWNQSLDLDPYFIRAKFIFEFCQSQIQILILSRSYWNFSFIIALVIRLLLSENLVSRSLMVRLTSIYGEFRWCQFLYVMVWLPSKIRGAFIEFGSSWSFLEFIPSSFASLKRIDFFF